MLRLRAQYLRTVTALHVYMHVKQTQNSVVSPLDIAVMVSGVCVCGGGGGGGYITVSLYNLNRLLHFAGSKLMSLYVKYKKCTYIQCTTFTGVSHTFHGNIPIEHHQMNRQLTETS